MTPAAVSGAAGRTVDAATSLPGYLIARDPLIVWGPNQPGRNAGPASVLADIVGNRRTYFLFALSATRESDAALAGDVAEVERLRACHPQHRHIVLCNTRREVERFKERGVPAILCSALSFVDETRFVIEPEARKEYDAIYNASLTPVKRHELCRDVRSLALIYHWHAHGKGDPVPEVLAAYRERFPEAHFVNDESGRYQRLDSDSIRHWINRARVGLCLSAREGAMLATMEYLLCGVPVVSTPSIGGRDRVLDARYSLVVEPDPTAVAAAVRTLAARPNDPVAIRHAACDAMRNDRLRLLRLIESIYREEALRFPADAAWTELFRRTAWPMTTVGALLSAQPIAAIPRKRMPRQTP
jgi:glycosyltransferase involved in cell wall biosynthesis